MTTPAETYRASAAALRALIPGAAEPDQQTLAAAALCLDHAAQVATS